MSKTFETDGLYWQSVEAMQWDKRRDYKAISKEFFAKVGVRGMEALEKFVGSKVGELYAAVEEFEKKGKSLEVGSDDGFSDVSYHIVGCGQMEFERCLKDPQLIAKRYKADNYQESFAYCFHEPEPEPERTEAQKEKSLRELLNKVEAVNKQQMVVLKEVEKLHTLFLTVSNLANLVKSDNKLA